MTEATLDAMADDLVRCCRGLAASGLVIGAAGNASVRVGGQVLLTATGARFADLEPDDLVLLDAAGQVTSDGRRTRRPSSELALHLEVYARRPDVGAVVHTHGRHAVALSTLMDAVPPLHYYAVDLGREIAVAPYRTFGTVELAEATTAALGDDGAVVMAHHGGLTVGADLAAATARAELLEWLCEVALLATAAGTPRALAREALEAVARRSREHRSGAEQA